MPQLPPPVQRYRDIALRDGPWRIETLDIDTTGWMRRPGVPAIPLCIRMTHRVGQAFVHDIRIGRGALAVRFGLDAYVGGHGLMRVGPSVAFGAHYDEGALIAMWGEELPFPSAWEDRDDLRWEPLDDATARLVVAGPEREVPITVGFHRGSGFPVSCTADRYKGDGPRVRWRVASTDWRRWPSGVLAPGRFRVRWSDEPRPWLDLRTTSLRVNVPVDDALRRGERAVAALPALSSP